MKLLELLEAGKKVTHDNRNYLDEGDYLILKNGEIEMYSPAYEFTVSYEINYEKLKDDGWYEYKEKPKYKTNFDMEEVTLYYYNTILNKTVSKVKIDDDFDEGILNNFNVFKDRKLVEYIQAKQLLERKLMMFSYLNGADEIDWKKTNEKKYYIECYYNHYKDKLEIATDYTYDFMDDDRVYFKTKEIAEKALELYRSEIKEVMELRKEFGF